MDAIGDVVMKKIIEVEFGSDKYNQLLELRLDVLHDSLSDEFIDGFSEGSCLHVACVDNIEDKVIGGYMLLPVDNNIIRIMQVVVDDKYRGQGIGKDLVAYAEKLAIKNNYKKIVMHARISAVDFYTKLDYKMIGNVFEEKGISFLKMGKKFLKK